MRPPFKGAEHASAPPPQSGRPSRSLWRSLATTKSTTRSLQGARPAAPSPRRTPTDPSMAPPSAARVAWDVEQLSTVPAELGGHEVQGARVELIIRPAPDLVINEDVRFEVRLDAGNYPARPPAVRRLTEHVKAVDGVDAAGSVNLPILDPRAEPNGWSGLLAGRGLLRAAGRVSEGGGGLGAAAAARARIF